MSGKAQKEVLFSGDWVNVIKEQDREYMTRNNCTAIAIIIAVTDDNELLLTEQFRVPVGGGVLELPAGMVGDEPNMENESAVDAAKRELLEETGYEALEIKQVAKGPISSGISSEVMTFFYANKVRYVNEGGGTENENITVHKAPIAKIESYIEEHSHLQLDPKIYIGLHFARIIINNHLESDQLESDMISADEY